MLNITILEKGLSKPLEVWPLALWDEATSCQHCVSKKESTLEGTVLQLDFNSINRGVLPSNLVYIIILHALHVFDLSY